MKCERCCNQIKETFFYFKGRYICRQCLKYKEKEKNEYVKGDGNYFLNYELTSEQKKASAFLLEHIKTNKDCILEAVTGSGKTEITYESISYCVKNNLKIGFAIARRDVVIELFKRISKDFKNTTVALNCGGSKEIIDGDIVILTTHKLYDYKNYFDVIIIDEYDAFPFYKNKMLEEFLNNSLKGIKIIMSATIPFKSKIDTFVLNKRYHGQKLDVPKIKTFYTFKTIKKFIATHKGIILIYFPTIKLQEKIAKKFKCKYYLMNSKVKNRKEILARLNTEENAICLSTLVLERGVTFKNVHVIVYKANHELFKYENLVQICGRVGRKMDYPRGDILFLCDSKNKEIRKCIKKIKKCNE